jgi:hypothetical protein
VQSLRRAIAPLPPLGILFVLGSEICFAHRFEPEFDRLGFRSRRLTQGVERGKII